jgi:hypothetical protein
VKKVVSISLIALLLLNVMGYYAVLLGIKYQNARNLTTRFDNDNYDKLQEITLRVPITVPYYQDTNFERVDGEIEHNGEFYRLVKQKLAKDTLYIVCVKDVKSKQIKQALSDYVKTFTDQSADAPQVKLFATFIKDYITSAFSLAPQAGGWDVALKFHHQEESVLPAILFRFSPPPEA